MKSILLSVSLLYNAISGVETKGLTNPWVFNTRGGPDFGPVQLHPTRIQDYLSRKPEMFTLPERTLMTNLIKQVKTRVPTCTNELDKVVYEIMAKKMIIHDYREGDLDLLLKRWLGKDNPTYNQAVKNRIQKLQAGSTAH